MQWRIINHLSNTNGLNGNISTRGSAKIDSERCSSCMEPICRCDFGEKPVGKHYAIHASISVTHHDSYDKPLRQSDFSAGILLTLRPRAIRANLLTRENSTEKLPAMVVDYTPALASISVVLNLVATALWASIARIADHCCLYQQLP